MATGYERIPAGVIERYSSATGTSDLTGFGGMVPEGMGSPAADLLAAAGLNGSGIGQALMRLVEEWEGAAKPRHPNEAVIKALAEEFRLDDERAKTKAKMERQHYTPQGRPETRARATAYVWYSKSLRELAGKLRTRSEVMALMNEWAARKQIHQDDVGLALFHFLSPKCPVCDGLGHRKIPDAPALGKPCYHCHTTGETIVNAQQDKIINWLKSSLKSAGGELRKRRG